MPDKSVSNHQNFLERLIEAIQELTSILLQEIALLGTSRPGEIQKLVPLKNELIATYHKELAELNSHGGVQASGNGKAIRRLKQEIRVFQTTLTDHKRLVKTLKKISEDMIKTISEEVVRSQSKTNRYTASGSKTVGKSPTSISLNRTI